MIVHSIRLRNIKSYASNADGTGVLIPFHPGINRIAGRNGEGKSTLIEALGYALFLCDPVFEENFQVQTYFLRSGEKHGEIEVSFEFEGAQYQVIRSLGARNPIRDKIVIMSDHSLAAEGTSDVDAFLCRLFRLPAADRLREWFSKLIGVKQGRLTWPFDTKPADARRHFEPLFDVDLFRQCFDRLKGVTDHLEEQRARLDVEAEGLRQRILDRADSPERSATLRASAELLQSAVQSNEERLRTIQREVDRLEALETAVRQADLAARQADERRQLAETSMQHATQALQEAQTATQVLEETRAASQCYSRADGALRLLLDKQAERDHLDARLRVELERLTSLETRLATAREQDLLLTQQILDRTSSCEKAEAEAGTLAQETLMLETPLAARATARDAARLQFEPVRARWAETRATFQRHAHLNARWKDDAATLRSWAPQRVAELRRSETKAAEKAAELDRQCAAAREGRAHLAKQLTEIGGGVCPFLREACRQFDASRVERDLSSHDRTLAELESAHRQAAADAADARQRREAGESDDARFAQMAAQWDSRFTELAREHDLLVEELNRTEMPSVGHHPSPVLPRLEGMQALTGRARTVSERPPSLDATVWSPPFDIHVVRHAQQRFLEAVDAVERSLVAAFDEESAAIAAIQSQLNALKERLFHRRHQAQAFRKDLAQLGELRERQRRAAAEATQAMTPLQETVAALRTGISAFASLATEIAAQQEMRQRHAAEHARHLAAAGTAAELARRTEQTSRASQHAETVRREAADAAQRACGARQALPPEALPAARQAAIEATVQLRASRDHFERARQDLTLAETRLREWQEATQRAATVRDTQTRLATARDLNDRARRLLRDAAPLVAQHLCQHIAHDAQQILARLHPEATVITWNAESYSLRLEPGERRFAMLSGGEQTKVALALTLAMIREFTTLRFCVFDEPTYGVDADSRERLARTVVDLQQAAGFDQILLVSHDDAFEGVIEHVVLLHKDAVEGTRAVAS